MSHHITSRAPLSQSPSPHPHIPHHIFQTWDTAEVSPGMHAAMSSWRDLNPDWAYHFYSDADCEQFIAEHFEQAVLDAYQQLIPRAYRADLWRYCALYVVGGIYIDAKFIAEAPIKDWLPDSTKTLLIRDFQDTLQENGGFLQGILASAPKQPLFKIAIEKIIEQVSAGRYGNNPLSVTGPDLLGKAFNSMLNHPENSPVSPGDYTHLNQTYTVLLAGASKETIHCAPIKLWGKKICRTYTNYYQERNLNSEGCYSLEKNYPDCWFRREVFRHGKIASEPLSLYYLKYHRNFWVQHLRFFYKRQEIKKGRETFQLACTKGAISFWLVRKLISYEIRQGVKIFFKKIGQIINNSIT